MQSLVSGLQHMSQSSDLIKMKKIFFYTLSLANWQLQNLQKLFLKIQKPVGIEH